MRFRKELGDLTDLKKSIKKNGLIHPIVKDSKGNLIAGARREQACKDLGIEPEVRIVDFDNPQQAEIDENTCRKDFTPRESYEIYQYYNENHSRQGKRNDSNGNGDFVQNPNKVVKPIAAVAKFTGKSIDTISKLKQIFESPYEEVKIDLDLDKTSINDAYKRVKIRRKNDVEKERMRKLIADIGHDEARKEEWRRYNAKREQRLLRKKERRTLALKMIDLGYKTLAMKMHPDKGGSSDGMIELLDVKQQLLSYVKRRSDEVLNFD
jgi:uncharacterized protein YktA (UPF0223 family)